MRSSKPQTPSLKITAQYRAKRGMVYELESATGSPLGVHVWREVADGSREAWRVEAHDGHLANATVVGKSGATAAEAQNVITLGYQAWIDQQLQRPASLELPHVQQVFATNIPPSIASLLLPISCSSSEWWWLEEWS